MRRERIGQAISRLTRAVAYYEKLEVGVERVVAEWQELEADERRRVGEVAPDLVTGLLDLEVQVGGLADVS